MVEYALRKIEEEVKAMQCEIKENVQGPNSDRKETGTQINSLDQEEEINIQPEQNEGTRIQKIEERLRNLRDNFKLSNIWIIGVPEGEEEEPQIENLYEKIMKEPWLVWLSGWVLACESSGRYFDSQSRAHAWVAGQVPGGGNVRSNHTLLFLSFSFPLSKNE